MVPEAPNNPTHSLTWLGFPFLIPVRCRQELVGSWLFSAQAPKLTLTHIHTHMYNHIKVIVQGVILKGFS